ncbi:MAG: ATPase [Acidimicrobiia bacterium]|nr:ATPase [Acidimicrobiia bacterium]
MPPSGRPALEHLQAAVALPVPPAQAFSQFTGRFALWWPAEFSWSGADLLEDIGIEDGEGGFLYERGPHGFRLDWGRVLEWQPPHRLRFTWQIGPDRVPVPDPAHASEVDVAFVAEPGGGTRVEVRHGCWERHGEGAATYREQFAHAWPYALGRLREHVLADAGHDGAEG